MASWPAARLVGVAIVAVVQCTQSQAFAAARLAVLPRQDGPEQQLRQHVVRGDRRKEARPIPLQRGGVQRTPWSSWPAVTMAIGAWCVCFAVRQPNGGPCRGPSRCRSLRTRTRIRRLQSQAAVEVREGQSLKPCDEWIAKLDLEAFGAEVHALGQRLKKEMGAEDKKHLDKIVLWSRGCAIVGLLTMWMAPNPLTVLALSLWTTSAWAMVGHHVSHGGYNRTDPSGNWTSRQFARGSLLRRAQDWFDWMLPEAWNLEHNQLHHYRLGEDADPDLVERNTADWTGPKKWALVAVTLLTWKWSYYAPNTYKELKVHEMQRKGTELPAGFDPMTPLTLAKVLEGAGGPAFSFGELVKEVMGPYFLGRFFLLPLPLLFFGPALYGNAVANLFLADVLSNVHSAIIILTNHAGEDMYKFAGGCKPRSPTYYLRAVTSSVNFDTGGDVNDFMHGWLNYQIEHHAWPDLSMLAYRKGQPELKRICEKHGVPYVQENVFVRLKKTVDIMVGHTRMRPYPEEYESKADAMVWSSDKVRGVMA